jgi:hypothetical protein
MKTYLDKSLITWNFDDYGQFKFKKLQKEDEIIGTIKRNFLCYDDTALINKSKYIPLYYLRLLETNNKLFLSNKVDKCLPHFSCCLKSFSNEMDRVLIDSDIFKESKLAGRIDITNDTYLFYDYNRKIILINVMHVEDLIEKYLFDDERYKHTFYEFMDEESLSLYEYCIKPTIFNDFSTYNKEDEE